MDGHDHVTSVPLVAFMAIETAALFGQPVPKRRAFHFCAPFDGTILKGIAVDIL